MQSTEEKNFERGVSLYLSYLEAPNGSRLEDENYCAWVRWSRGNNSISDNAQTVARDKFLA